MTAPTVHFLHLDDYVEVTDVERCPHCGGPRDSWGEWLAGKSVPNGYWLHVRADQARVTA